MTGHRTPALEAAAVELVALKDAFYAAAKASAQADPLTSAHCDATLAAGRAVDEACEVVRRRHFPRAHRVVAAQGEVFTVSRTARSIRRVWPADEQGCR